MYETVVLPALQEVRDIPLRLHIRSKMANINVEILIRFIRSCRGDVSVDRLKNSGNHIRNLEGCSCSEEVLDLIVAGLLGYYYACTCQIKNIQKVLFWWKFSLRFLSSWHCTMWNNKCRHHVILAVHQTISLSSFIKQNRPLKFVTRILLFYSGHYLCVV